VQLAAGCNASVALRLICEREAEIEVFKSREYWTVDVLFGTAKKQTLKARLTHLDGRKLAGIRRREPVRIVRPRQQHLAAGAGVERQDRTDRHTVPQARSRIPGRDAQPPVARTQVQLHALAGLVVQPAKHRARDPAQLEPVTGAQGQLGQPRSEPEGAVIPAPDQAVYLERDQQPVRRGPRQPAGLRQRTQRPRTAGQQPEQRHRAVEHADAAGPRSGRPVPAATAGPVAARVWAFYIVHKLSSLSHILRQRKLRQRKQRPWLDACSTRSGTAIS